MNPILLSPKIDFVFKALFGQEQNKPLLLSLLNAVLDRVDGKKMVEIELLNTELGKSLEGRKSPRLDLLAKDKEGRFFHVEMQAQSHNLFLERMLYYWARLFSNQLESGQEYKTLTPVISILFTDFVAVPELSDYYTCWMWKEVEHETILSDYGQIHIIEFPKFEESWDEANDLLEQWVFFLNEVDQMQYEPLPVWADDRLREAYKELERLSQKPELRALYEAQLDEIRLYRTLLSDSYEEGHEEGYADGRKEGRKEGREEGREEGKEEGRLEVVRQLLEQGLALEMVAKVSGYTLEQLEALTQDT